MRPLTTPRPRSHALGPTYRLQLTPSFGFDAARDIVDYIASLGIAFVYLSPVFEAAPGSEHGYDVTDPTTIRAELGGEATFFELADAVHRAGMGVLLDIVPNHMSTFAGGPWWRDVLRRGRASSYAPVFDIAWEPPDPDGEERVVLPILGDRLEAVLERGELAVVAGNDGPALSYFDTELPLAPDGPAGNEVPIRDLLAAQHYRLAWWRDPERNYRRFFTIDDLVGVRQEDPTVFEWTHGLIADLLGRGAVDGLRVDHVDGLADPEDYLRRLRDLTGNRPVVIEKILTGEETLRRSWPVEGTTGYEVADDITHALVDPAGMEVLVAGAVADGEGAVHDVVAEAKALVVTTSFGSEVRRVARLLDLEEPEVVAATVAMPVYRTYVSDRGGSEVDVQLLEVAGGPAFAKTVLDVGRNLEGAVRFQQLTSAAMAKGVEDTAWYRLVGKLPLLEVGGDPSGPGDGGAARMVRHAADRVASRELSLIPGMTHDTKRSSDVRARLLALSGAATEFEAGLDRLAGLVPPRPLPTGGRVPGRLDLRRIAETCLAMAPFEGADTAAWDEVAGRVVAALRKGAREAKARDSWEDVNEPYEEALADAARTLLAEGGRGLTDIFGPMVSSTARHGAVLSLAQVVLRSCLPGVPDCYQGDETWKLALVDPDNRRPVDYDRLAADAASMPANATPGEAAALRRSFADGRIKQYVTRRCLEVRAACPAPFAAGADCTLLDAGGEHQSAVLSVARLGEDCAAVLGVVTRRPHVLPAPAPDGDLPVGIEAWGTTSIAATGALAGRRWTDAFSGAVVEEDGGRLPVAGALATLPVALLVSEP